MDTITHGIAGALLGKAVFRGDDLFSRRPMGRARIITWSLMLGAIFPDSDVIRDMVSRNDLLVLTWHRSITHSLLCLPLFAVALAALTHWFVRRRKWDAPSFAALTGIYAVGILSHILLDLVTSFGTMIWSPLKWSRPAWDLIFIIDFSLSAILLVPQILAWVYARGEGLRRRALGSWLVFGSATLGVAALGAVIGAPISLRAILIVVVVLAAAFLLPALRHWGLRVRLASWNLAGLLLALGYIGTAMYAHHAALARVDHFVSALRLEAQARGALTSCAWTSKASRQACRPRAPRRKAHPRSTIAITRTLRRIPTSTRPSVFRRCRRFYGSRASPSRDFIRKAQKRSWKFPTCAFRRRVPIALHRLRTGSASPPMAACGRRVG